MNVWVNPDGTRDREFRPYIEEEETAKSVYLYSPNGPAFHYGLYDGAQPSCGYWQDLYWQYPSKIPMASVSKDGRVHLMRPNYTLREPLMRHISPTIGAGCPNAATCVPTHTSCGRR